MAVTMGCAWGRVPGAEGEQIGPGLVRIRRPKMSQRTGQPIGVVQGQRNLDRLPPSGRLRGGRRQQGLQDLPRLGWPTQFELQLGVQRRTAGPGR